MIILELFSGTESISNAFRARGHECYTLDFDKQFNPTYCMDIADFDPYRFIKEHGYPDVIWASPDCTVFSVAAICHNWKKEGEKYTPLRPETKKGMDNIYKILEIISACRPKYWFMENPRGMLRKIFPSLHDNFTIHSRHHHPYEMKTVTYCTYGDSRMKPTDIWSNAYRIWTPRKACHNGNPDCHHERAPRGSKCGTQGIKGAKDRGRIPYELCQEIVEACENG